MIHDYSDIAVKKPKLQLCKNNLSRTIIGNVKEAYDIKRKISLGGVSELSFSVPFDVFYRNTQKKNKNEPELKERRIIKFTEGIKTEYFLIHKITKNMDDSSDHKRIECLSLAVELKDKPINSLSVISYNATQITSLVLQETIWSMDYIHGDFDLLYRTFEISSATVLDAIQQIAETFNALIVYDTVNRKISFYKFETYGQYKGLSVKYGKLLKNITYETNTSEYATRLVVKGKDGLGINSVNPTGTNFLDDYSSLLRGFQRSPDKTVISSAQDISDSLANSLLDYQELVESKQSEFSTLLNNWNTKRGQLIAREGELIDLQGDLRTIEAQITVANSTGNNPTPYVTQKNQKLSEMNIKQGQINTLNNDISNINSDIDALNDLLLIENNFTEVQIFEWNPHIVYAQWTNNYISDPQQLIEAGKEELMKMREPKIVVNVDIVNLREIITEYHNWDKLVLGDIMKIQVDKLGIHVEAKILEMDVDYESGNINLTIGNVREILNDQERFMKNLYNSVSTSTTFNNNQYKYLDAYSKANDTYRMLQDKFDATKIRIEGSFDESVEIGDKGIRVTSPSNPNNVLVLQSGVLAISNTGGNYWNTVADASGLWAERLVGTIIAGNDLTIENSSGSFKVNANGVVIKDMDLTLTRTDNKSRILMNATDGIKIQSSTNGTSWTDKLLADVDGNLLLRGNVEIGSGNSIFKANQNGISLGHATFSSAPFRVDVLGNAHMASLNMTGGTIKLGSNFNVTAAGVLTATGANISGNITMGEGSSINWNDVNSDPVATGAASTASSALGAAGIAQSMANSIAAGTYSGGTFINGKMIYSPTIMTGTSGKHLKLEGSELQSVNGSTLDGFTLDGNTGYLLWYSNGVKTGGIYKDSSQFYEQLLVSHNYLALTGTNGISIYSSGYIDLTGSTITLGGSHSTVNHHGIHRYYGTHNFSEATVTGVVARFA